MDLEFIYTDKNYVELGYIKNATFDIENGTYRTSQNDFEITMGSENRDENFKEGSLFYAEGTEWGGIVTHIKVTTSSNSITLIGRTFRGMLEKEYVQPPEGASHLELRGEANACINELIAGRFNELFIVDEIGDSGIEIEYDIRDLNLLEAIEKALGSANAKLDIRHQEDGKIHLRTARIEDLSDSVQFDNAYQVNMTVETKDQPYNHILALGKGELTDRLRVNLYLQPDGSWGDTEVYGGMDKKTYKHEDTNIELEAELILNAIARVLEANKQDILDIAFSSDDAELFDVVGAKEEITGVSFKDKITQKILKGTPGNFQVSYKVGE